MNWVLIKYLQLKKSDSFPLRDRNLYSFIFIILYVGIMLFLCYNTEIWLDESYTLNTTSFSLIKVVDLSYHFEAQPPLYFILISLWRRINDGIFFSRLFSLIFILLSAVILNKIVNVIFKSLKSQWLIVLFLLNPFTVWAALEIRLYAFLLFLSFLELYVFWLIFFHNREKLKIVFIIISILGIYTQYLFVFLIIGLSLILLVSKGWRQFWNFCLLTIPIIIFITPNIFFIAEQYKMNFGTHLNGTGYSRLRRVVAFPFDLLMRINISILNGRILGWIVRFAFILFFTISIRSLYIKFKKEGDQDFITLLYLSIPVIFVMITFSGISLVSNMASESRYLTMVYPFFILILSVFFILGKGYKKIMMGILISYFLIFLVYTYKPPYLKTKSFRASSAFIEGIENKNEPILFHHRDLILSFKHYYEGKNRLVPINQAQYDFNYFNSILKDTIELKMEILKNMVNETSFLFVSESDSGFTHKRDITNQEIDLFLNFNYTIETDTIIPGNKDEDYLRIQRLIIK